MFVSSGKLMSVFMHIGFSVANTIAITTALMDELLQMKHMVRKLVWLVTKNTHNKI